jgi:hypothetical protein
MSGITINEKKNTVNEVSARTEWEVYVCFCRYDEWIRPEQIVNVLNKPSEATVLKKKAKESPPKSPKGQVSIEVRSRSPINLMVK